MRASIIPFLAFLALSASPAVESFTFQNQYPSAREVPPTDTDLVKQWVAAINMSAVPDIPRLTANADGQPTFPSGGPPAGACHWTYDNCINGDITVCSTIGDWGLTFDDGPTSYTAPLYDFLDKSNQKATLFMVGSNVVANPDLVLRACNSGHHLAIHTWSHHALTTLTNEQIVAEVKYTELAIKEICGVTTKYFRPPYGDVDNRVRGLLSQMGYINVIWDLDTNDWQLPPGGNQTAAAVDALFAKWIGERPGDTTGHICLQHDLYQASVDAAIRNLPDLQSAYKVQSVAQCLGDTKPYVEGAGNTTLTNTTQNATSSAALPTSVVVVTVSPSASQAVQSVVPTNTNGASTLTYSTTFAFLSVIVGAFFMTL